MLFTANIENLKTLKYQTFLKKKIVLSIACSKFDNEDEENI